MATGAKQQPAMFLGFRDVGDLEGKKYKDISAHGKILTHTAWPNRQQYQTVEPSL
jgi:hypothetical protein